MLLAAVPQLGAKWSKRGDRERIVPEAPVDGDGEVLTEVDVGHFVAIAGENGRKETP
jgi:hypothetical protein